MKNLFLMTALIVATPNFANAEWVQSITLSSGNHGFQNKSDVEKWAKNKELNLKHDIKPTGSDFPGLDVSKDLQFSWKEFTAGRAAGCESIPGGVACHPSTLHVEGELTVTISSSQYIFDAETENYRFRSCSYAIDDMQAQYPDQFLTLSDGRAFECNVTIYQVTSQQ